MVEAGLTPEQVLRSATGVAAGCLGADDVGTLEAGRWADFLVLDADPLADVANTRTLRSGVRGGPGGALSRPRTRSGVDGLPETWTRRYGAGLAAPRRRGRGDMDTDRRPPRGPPGHGHINNR